MSSTSPTQRSLRNLEARGYTAAVVEKWNPFAHIRQDLFGFADLIAFDAGGDVLLVQTTTASNAAARKTKIAANQTASAWLEAGNRIEVHGWAKKKNRWQVKIEEITPPNRPG